MLNMLQLTSVTYCCQIILMFFLFGEAKISSFAALIHILGRWQFCYEVLLIKAPLDFLPLVMDDLIGLYLLRIQYSLKTCTVTRSCCLPYPLLDDLVSYFVSKFPACLPHMQVYLYPDLSLWSSLQTQKNVLGITKGKLQFPLLLLLLGDHSVSHPSLFPLPLVSLFPDISLSYTHDYLQKQIFLWHNTRYHPNSLPLVPKLMISSLFLTSQLL